MVRLRFLVLEWACFLFDRFVVPTAFDSTEVVSNCKLLRMTTLKAIKGGKLKKKTIFFQFFFRTVFHLTVGGLFID